jgi:D-methionine transport system permease protein
VNHGPWTDHLDQLWQALRETLYMVAFAAGFTFVIGLALGVVLYLTGPGGLLANRLVHGALGIVVNVGRSLPFIILLISVMPLTRLVVGTSLGSTAAIVPLTLGSAPFFGRVVETALREVDPGRIEAVLSMGATTSDVVIKVLLPEALPGLLAGATLTLVMFVDYSAMAGAIGAGGLGNFAIVYGYQRFNTNLMIVTVVVLVVLVQALQSGGNWVVRRVAHAR